MTIPREVARAAVEKIINQRLIHRTRVMGKPDPEVVILDDFLSDRFWLVHTRDGGSLRAWRDMLALYFLDIALDAMQELGVVEGLENPEVRRSVWEHLTRNDEE